MRRADRAHAPGGQLERQLTFLDDDVVVAQRLPLLEVHGAGLYASAAGLTSAIEPGIAARVVAAGDDREARQIVVPPVRVLLRWRPRRAGRCGVKRSSVPSPSGTQLHLDGRRAGCHGHRGPGLPAPGPDEPVRRVQLHELACGHVAGDHLHAVLAARAADRRTPTCPSSAWPSRDPRGTPRPSPGLPRSRSRAGLRSQCSLPSRFFLSSISASRFSASSRSSQNCSRNSRTGCEALRACPVQAPRAVASLLHESRLLQYAQVLRDRRPGHVEMRCDLTRGELLVAHERQDLAPVRRGDCLEGGFHYGAM